MEVPIEYSTRPMDSTRRKNPSEAFFENNKKYFLVFVRLLVLSPAKRLSARETLSHPWLTPDEKTVELSK